MYLFNNYALVERDRGLSMFITTVAGVGGWHVNFCKVFVGHDRTCLSQTIGSKTSSSNCQQHPRHGKAARWNERGQLGWKGSLWAGYRCEIAKE